MTLPGTDDALLQMSDGFILPDGRFRFTIERCDGESLTVSSSSTEATDAIVYLAGIIKAASEAQDSETGGPPKGADMAVMRASGIGLAVGNDPSVTSLVVNLGGVPLGIEIPNSDLVRLADDFSRHARTLSAPTGHKN